MLKIVSNFNERFSQALELRGIKAVEISEKTGISESTLSQYKGGYSKPKDKRLILLANVLDVDPLWLKGLNVPMREAEFATLEQYEQWAESNEYPISDEEYLMVVAYRKADAGIKQSIKILLQIDDKEKNADVS